MRARVERKAALNENTEREQDIVPAMTVNKRQVLTAKKMALAPFLFLGQDRCQ